MVTSFGKSSKHRQVDTVRFFQRVADFTLLDRGKGSVTPEDLRILLQPSHWSSFINLFINVCESVI